MREEQVTGKRQHRRNREEVERLVNAFERSGLRRREFCLQHGVALGTLDLWRKRRRQERGMKVKGNEDAGVKAASGSRLVAVEVAGWPARTESKAVSGVTVVLSQGRRIEVTRGFDAGTLERLLDVLERG